ncbi:MAG: DUF4062 domain-containing protein [Ferruginibacter sp.]
MSQDQNAVLRIFLSSTAIDMQEHRKKVIEAIQRLNNLPVVMEYFGALPNEPVDACKKKVLESNALVVMVAHRYGWVPKKEENGDDKKSITWIEVETAFENKIPVFAFIVDESYAWTFSKEQDQLLEAKDTNESAAIFEKVQAMKEFKSFLQSRVRDKFTNSEDLALKVATSLSNWITKRIKEENDFTDDNKNQIDFDEYSASIEHNRINKSVITSDLLYGKDISDLDAEIVNNLSKTERVVKEFLDKDIDKSKLSEFEQLEHFHLCKANKIYKGTFLCLGQESQLNDVCDRVNESTFIVFEGQDKTKLKQSQRITGNLIQQFIQLFNLIRKQLSLERVLETNSDDYEIPKVAIDEILANAFVHRDYNISRGSTIAVNLFNDRLEIQNPGILIDGINVEDIQKKEISHIRNLEISVIFWMLGYVERAGSGISRANKVLSKRGLKPIVFSLDKDVKTFTAIIYRQQNLQNNFIDAAVKSIPLTFRIVHHLQPAPHFKGRKKIFDELKRWWESAVSPDRVLSLIAIGGTGKTAVVERFLESIKDEKLRGSVLVWSFYDEPNTDAFLNEACLLFSGEEESKAASGKLERLQRALAYQNNQNLIVLDGLERIQSEGGAGYAKGDLEDYRIRNLLATIARGLGNTRVLITSRFKLNDLAQLENAGYKSYNLEVLDEESAIEVLKAWKITGEDKTLARLAESVGRHALSVSVLGSYLNHYCNSDPEAAKEFRLDEIAPDEPQAARLARILGGYAKNLHDQERDLIIRLSVFPNGVSIDILGYLIDAGGEIAGTLIGITQKKLLNIAEKLKNQGLIYSYKNNKSIIYTAHPFLRDYFRNLLGVRPEYIHEIVREKLAIELDTKPDKKPTEINVLDKYEKLIEYSILAGKYIEAYDIYMNVMAGEGKKNHLLYKLGDYGRIVRIASMFSLDGNPQTFTSQLSDYNRSVLSTDWGIASLLYGNLQTAINCFNFANKIDRQNQYLARLVLSFQNIAWVNINKGLFINARSVLMESLNYVNKQRRDEYIIEYDINIHELLAYTFHALGEVTAAKNYLLEAKELKAKSFPIANSIYEIEYCFVNGDKLNSFKLAKENIESGGRNAEPRVINFSKYFLGMTKLSESINIAREYLKDIREWTEKSGEMEVIIRSQILASEIAFYSKDYVSALAECTTGLNHAENSGYGKLAIDLLLQLSKIYLEIPDYETSLSHARNALERSSHPDCQYAWGQANGLHLCGVCHKALGQYELAHQRLEAALTLREKIQHPDVEVTRKLLSELPIKE